MTGAAKDLDLSILPPNYRAVFEALQATAARAAELEDIVKCLEHLVAELNHVVHGKRSEKLSEDERQLAFEDLQIAVSETEEQKQDQATGDVAPKRKRVAKRNRGNLPENLPRIERVIEPDSLVCPCGCGEMHKSEDRIDRLDIVPAQLRVLVTVRPNGGCERHWFERASDGLPRLYRWCDTGTGPCRSDRRRPADRRGHRARSGQQIRRPSSTISAEPDPRAFRR